MVASIRARSSFRTPFKSQSVHGRQTLLKSVWQCVYPKFPLMQEKFSEKTSLFVGYWILGLFGNTLAACHMYSRQNWGKFLQHVKTLLSQKRKTFFLIFIAFLQSTQNFAHFENKVWLYSLNSWQVIDSEKCGCFNVGKLLFQKYSLKVKVLTGAKHCWNLFASTFILIFH